MKHTGNNATDCNPHTSITCERGVSLQKKLLSGGSRSQVDKGSRKQNVILAGQECSMSLHLSLLDLGAMSRGMV